MPNWMWKVLCHLSAASHSGFHLQRLGRLTVASGEPDEWAEHLQCLYRVGGSSKSQCLRTKWQKCAYGQLQLL